MEAHRILSMFQEEIPKQQAVVGLRQNKLLPITQKHIHLKGLESNHQQTTLCNNK
jgi:hypothetical protein